MGPVLDALADPMRRRILTALAAEELCTTHLQTILAAKQTLVSHHLRILRDAGLVLTAPCGRFTYYRLAPGAFDDLSGVLHDLAGASHRPAPRRAC
ncbi:metalloregulator ArsR/SmtB family transcription factor [Lapillicoccus sp.]|uniref:ArsR/SmtB family transcription factor n=1 Tax=Lapillicoccus sp. TaxID=1909287 RepID=UPI0025D61377|nr:metalloregulator ArsR/SmtB family transcription factor [Lapillicoccus sp.]